MNDNFDSKLGFFLKAGFIYNLPPASFKIVLMMLILAQFKTEFKTFQQILWWSRPSSKTFSLLRLQMNPVRPRLLKSNNLIESCLFMNLNCRKG